MVKFDYIDNIIKKKIERRRKIKNFKRSLNAKASKEFKPLRKQSGILLVSNLGYTSSKTKIIDRIYFPAAIGLIDSTKIGEAMQVSFNKLNFDFCLYYISPIFLEFSYCFRYSLINYSNIYSIYLNNIREEHLENLEFMNRDPFHVFESNLKLNFNFNKFELFLKLNDVIGKSNLREENTSVSLSELNYSSMVYNTSLVAGLVLNIHEFVDLKIKFL